jgi:hypothetical protein
MAVGTWAPMQGIDEPGQACRSRSTSASSFWTLASRRQSPENRRTTAVKADASMSTQTAMPLVLARRLDVPGQRQLGIGQGPDPGRLPTTGSTR